MKPQGKKEVLGMQLVVKGISTVTSEKNLHPCLGFIFIVQSTIVLREYIPAT